MVARDDMDDNGRIMWSDEELLSALHLRDAYGATCAAIGIVTGRSRNSVIGALHRIPEPTDDAIKPENRHGAMGPRWGLRVRGRE